MQRWEQTQRVFVGFRPESLERSDYGFALTVDIVEELGADAYIYGSFESHENGELTSDLIARIDPRIVPSRGERVTMRVRPDDLHLFSTGTGERLG